MTDAEWGRLEPLLAAASPAGRPSPDRRRVWDAIFWIACTRQPWHALPEDLGKADTAHRALRRAARAGVLGRLLIAVSDYPVLGGWDAMRWRISRACRRVARLLTMGQLLMADRLGLSDALPCDPGWLPQPHLSESVTRYLPLLRNPALRPRVLPLLRQLLRMMQGNRRQWRTA